jgi:uncharacterized membrane-anchored protein
MINYKWIIIAANLVILLGFFNYSIMQKEALIADGQLILLELAPVDPRSLMQGDYMRLNYAISENINNDSISKRGYCVIKLDDNGIGHRIRVQDGRNPMADQEYLIGYTLAGWGSINIGAESFFFQEGEAEKFDKAKYGGIKTDNHGNSILIGLYDENRSLIE